MSKLPTAKPKPAVKKPPATKPKQVVKKPPATKPKQVVKKPTAAKPKQVVKKPTATKPKQVVKKPTAAKPKPAVKKPPATKPKQVVKKPTAAKPKQVGRGRYEMYPDGSFIEQTKSLIENDKPLSSILSEKLMRRSPKQELTPPKKATSLKPLPRGNIGICSQIRTPRYKQIILLAGLWQQWFLCFTANVVVEH